MCYFWDCLVWVWVSECVLCVGQFVVGLGSECLLFVGQFLWVWGSVFILCVGMIGVDFGE